MQASGGRSEDVGLVWAVPEMHGGIAGYTHALWPHIQVEASRRGILNSHLIQSETIEAKDLLERLGSQSESGRIIVHFQHEYGIFGGKIPPFYSFPAMVRALRSALPSARILATAHTVLGRDFRYPIRGRGWQVPLRLAANRVFVPFAKRLWNRRTWKPLDGVIVHSESQVEAIREAGQPSVSAIPHFVPESGVDWREHFSERAGTEKVIVVFGYFSPEKGQDVAIRALPSLPASHRLILAGGARRKADQGYYSRCMKLIEQLGLSSRVEITGFVPEEQVDRIFMRADLVLAPFRYTSGSGSLVQALARKAPVLCSDLPLNAEIGARQPGAVALFRSEDAEDCAIKAKELLADSGRLASLSGAAASYAERYSLVNTARQHLDFYERLL